MYKDMLGQPNPQTNTCSYFFKELKFFVPQQKYYRTEFLNTHLPVNALIFKL